MAFFWMVACFTIWYWQRIPLSSGTVFISKLQQELAGYPAPYLLADWIRLFWHTTTFPPFVGLMLASYWLPWSQRIVRSMFGLFALFWLNAVAVTIDESPYLPRNAVTSAISHVYTELNLYGVIGIIVWAAISGIDKATGRATGRATRPARDEVQAREHPQRGGHFTFNNWMTRLAVITMACTLLAPLVRYQAAPEFRYASKAFADAVNSRDLRSIGESAVAILQAGEVPIDEVRDPRFKPAPGLKDDAYKDPRVLFLIAGLLNEQGESEGAAKAYIAALARLDKENLLDEKMVQDDTAP
jgi:hypothetical protein